MIRIILSVLAASVVLVGGLATAAYLALAGLCRDDLFLIVVSAALSGAAGIGSVGTFIVVWREL